MGLQRVQQRASSGESVELGTGGVFAGFSCFQTAASGAGLGVECKDLRRKSFFFTNAVRVFGEAGF